MEIKFDFEVDDRFDYVFNEEEKYFKLDTVRDAAKAFLKPLENEIDKYNNGIIIITVSDKINVLKELNVPARYDYNEGIPVELWQQIKESLTYTKFLSGLPSFLKDVY